MKVDRVDTVGGTVYIMTETHRYDAVLAALRELEPKARPIKHVDSDQKGRATGYTLPAATPSLDGIMRILREAEV